MELVTAFVSTVEVPKLRETVNEVSAPAVPGRTLETLQPSFDDSNEAKSWTVMLPSNLNASERGADWISIRFGDSEELVLVNSALPSGSPVRTDQFLSKNGLCSSPFRKIMCCSGSSHSSPGPSGEAEDWPSEDGDTSSTQTNKGARKIAGRLLTALRPIATREGMWCSNPTAASSYRNCILANTARAAPDIVARKLTVCFPMYPSFSRSAPRRESIWHPSHPITATIVNSMRAGV